LGLCCSLYSSQLENGCSARKTRPIHSTCRLPLLRSSVSIKRLRQMSIRANTPYGFQLSDERKLSKSLLLRGAPSHKRSLTMLLLTSALPHRPSSCPRRLTCSTALAPRLRHAYSVSKKRFRRFLQAQQMTRWRVVQRAITWRLTQHTTKQRIDQPSDGGSLTFWRPATLSSFMRTAERNLQSSPVNARP